MALLAVALLFLAVGPVVLLLGAATLCLPRVRAWLRPTRRVLAGWVGAVLLVAGLAVVVPDGWVPIAPGPGTWVTPSYVGRPVAGGTEDGPSGESPQVTTKGYGLDDCRRIELDAQGRLVTVCGGAGDPVLRLVDPGSLRLRASKDLPDRGGCPAAFALDAGGRVVVAARDRLLVVGTADAEGDPDLTTEATVDLGLGVDDCVAGLAVRGARTWFVSRDGVAGVVTGDRVHSVELADSVERPLAVDAGGAYVAGAEALHRVVLTGRRPTKAWSSPYDGGGERGAAPVPLPDGLVAVADNREPRLQVVFHRAETGAVVCRAEVFGDDEGATDGGLVAAGGGVVVQNSHGYFGPLSTVLGRTTDRGIARVDVVDGECRVTWTTAMDAPSGAPAVSEADGLVYAYVKRHSWLGVDAWYLAALDLDDGHLLWARRTGLGVLRDNHHGRITLGPDRSAYVPVLGGLVRVHDRG
ncbi:hypothetical protein [Nocardioides sp. T2.26MG-1]|uniref:hypothetical protein n=1 Tax=Nocardioides sp. T2.26MG-1 TaxID=3041166 RepID=UPI0024775296|nr:hypothetical protein [Nocardioides sp. T2.26MG-1]CAI9411911.1 hypothetical protein HIDPHFAB_01636 [Nocardioides sp. T2.26MG-1]